MKDFSLLAWIKQERFVPKMSYFLQYLQKLHQFDFHNEVIQNKVELFVIRNKDKIFFKTKLLVFLEFPLSAPGWGAKSATGGSNPWTSRWEEENNQYHKPSPTCHPVLWGRKQDLLKPLIFNVFIWHVFRINRENIIYTSSKDVIRGTTELDSISVSSFFALQRRCQPRLPWREGSVSSSPTSLTVFPN